MANLSRPLSDEESEGSEKEDDHVSNSIAFQVTFKKDVSAVLQQMLQHQKQQTQILMRLQ